MEATITFVGGAIPEEDTTIGAISKFVLIIWAKEGVARTTKSTEKSVVW